MGGAWGGSAAKAWPWESAASTAAFPPGVPGTGVAKGGPSTDEACWVGEGSAEGSSLVSDLNDLKCLQNEVSNMEH